MEEFLRWLQGTMPVPKAGGWYHLTWLFITVAACVLICVFGNKFSKKAVNITLLAVGIVLVLFEVYKQVILGFEYKGGGGNSTFTFRWWAFPFQFCSTPMYLMVLAGILRKGVVYDAILCFLATYAMFGGIGTLCYPQGVLVEYIGQNIQTMFWHCSMSVIAVMLLATHSIEFKFMSLLKAGIVFLVLVVIALVFDIVWYHCGDGTNVNLFYISPYFPCTVVILDVIYEKAPYIVFLLVYIIGFTLIATIILSVAIGFDKLFARIRRKRAEKTPTEN